MQHPKSQLFSLIPFPQLRILQHLPLHIVLSKELTKNKLLIFMSHCRPIILFTSLLLLFVACNDKSSSLAEPTVETKVKKGAFPLILEWSNEAPLTTKAPYNFAQDVAYDNHKRNKFDLISPKSDVPTPLVVYIHGGGFTRGDKKVAYNISDTIRRFVQEDVAFATINYRYLEHSEEGVIASLQDCQRFLQFVRHYAEELNIDKERIALYGSSAGGGAALWLGTHDDLANPNSPDPIARESSRVKAVVAFNTQATYDILRWEQIFERYNFSIEDPKYSAQTLFNFYYVDNFEILQTERYKTYRANVDMLGLMDANDAPIYVSNARRPTVPEETVDLFHHPYHATALQKVADEVGLPNMIADNRKEAKAMMGPVEFILRYLRQ